MKYYFLGICGTAMASLALLLKQKGHHVWGTDVNIYPPMSDLLIRNHIEIHEGYQIKNLDKEFDMAVIGNALTRGNPEIETILNKKLPFTSLPELIRKEFASPLTSIVISGTHGKTTTTALVSWMLDSAGLSPTFLIGGVSNNFDTSAKIGKGDHFIIEGDEYDCAFFDKRPKFIHYYPSYLIINNIEFDHADIYDSTDQIKDGFCKLIRTMPKNSLILANGDSPEVRDVLANAYSSVQFFGKGKNNDWFFSNQNYTQKGCSFIVNHHSQRLTEFHIPLHGEHQIYNTLGTIALCKNLGIDDSKIKESLLTFKGVKRRLELWGEINGALLYDDFAHHVTAVQNILTSLKKIHADKKLIAIYEPRTNTSVRNIFQEEISKALATADISLIMPIHRMDRIPQKNRLSLEKLKQDINHLGKQVFILDEYQNIWKYIPKLLDENSVAVLLTNGDLGGEYEKLRNLVIRPK